MKNRHPLRSAFAFLALFSLALLLTGCVQAPAAPTPAPTIAPLPTAVACTLEAKICPDGSAVGRTGPNCEFAPCPTLKPISSPTVTLQATATLPPLPTVLPPQSDFAGSINVMNVVLDDQPYGVLISYPVVRVENTGNASFTPTFDLYLYRKGFDLRDHAYDLSWANVTLQPGQSHVAALSWRSLNGNNYLPGGLYVIHIDLKTAEYHRVLANASLNLSSVDGNLNP